MAKFKLWSRRLVPILLMVTASLVGLLVNNKGQQPGLFNFPGFVGKKSSVSTTSKISVGVADIVHLYNPFRVSNCVEPFCPYDQAQSVTIASMKRAQAKAQRNNISVVLTAVTFPEDLDIIPDGFVALKPLQRSTATEYPNMSIQGVPRRLPFWQDVLNSLLEQKLVWAQTIVYTNSDIVLHPDFYTTIQEIIVHKGLSAFSINRQTVAHENVTTKQQYMAKDLDDILQIPNSDRAEHAGYDCFIFPWDVAGLLDLGNVFVGYPPLGIAILAQLMDFTGRKNNNRTKHFRRFQSHEKRATFHLGQDKVWKGDADHEAYTVLNEAIADNLTNARWRSILGRHRPNAKSKRQDRKRRSNQT